MLKSKSNSKRRGETVGGLSFIESLTLLFIALKLTGFLPTWNWLWVLSPLWITGSIVLTLAIIALIVGYVQDYFENETYDDEDDD